jgi:dephospho-CoA kinase
MLKVGLTGGLACGKSFVGKALAALGCHLIEADELGHRVLEPGGAAYDDVVRAFGAGILDRDGTIDRKRLAAEVFSKPERLALLNGFVHPRVFQLEEELMAQFRMADPHGITVVEAAILIETGSYKKFDRLIVVTCDEELQIARALERDKVGRDDVVARLNRQIPVSEKRKLADYVIDTSGTKDETLRQTREVYDLLRRIKT